MTALVPSMFPMLAGHDQACASTLHVAGNALRIYSESASLLADMIRDIRAARSRVWLESYIILADAAGQAIAEVLQERAQAGVDVRVLYDAVGCLRTPKAFFEELRSAGVAVHGYHTIAEAFSRGALAQILNRRDHRKLLIIDDDIGFFGGMNIVDQGQAMTVTQANARRLPVSAGWRDVHVRLQGPQQCEIAAAFDRLWRRTKPDALMRTPHWPLTEMLASTADGIYFFDSLPGLRFRSPVRLFLTLIRRARRNITISMAYFLPPGRLLRALFRARRRGVAITVIVPAQSDVRIVQWATRYLYQSLLRHGIHIFERQNQMLHSKVMVIDDHWTVVGSCNLDRRSLWHNLEFLAAIRSAPLAATVQDICIDEIKHSRRVTAYGCQRLRWWQRWLDRFAYALRRWL